MVSGFPADSKVNICHKLAVDDQFCLAVVKHVLLALLRIFQIYGHVGGTSLVNGNDGQRERNGAGKHDSHEVAGLHATINQLVCQNIGTARQFAIGHTVGGVGNGEVVRMLACLLLESLHEGHRRVNIEVLAST